MTRDDKTEEVRNGRDNMRHEPRNDGETNVGPYGSYLRSSRCSSRVLCPSPSTPRLRLGTKGTVRSPKRQPRGEYDRRGNTQPKDPAVRIAYEPWKRVRPQVDEVTKESDESKVFRSWPVSMSPPNPSLTPLVTVATLRSASFTHVTNGMGYEVESECSGSNYR